MTATMDPEVSVEDVLARSSEDQVEEKQKDAPATKDADDTVKAESAGTGVEDDLTQQTEKLTVTEESQPQYPLPEGLTEAQLAALDEVRSIVKGDKRLTALKLSDHDFMRYLKARNFKPDRVEKSLYEYADFHDKYNIDTMDLSLPPYPIRGYPHPHGDDAYLRSAEWQELNQVLAMCTHKHDKQNRPVFFMRVGSSVVGDLNKVTGGLERVLQWHVTASEYMHSVIMPHLSKQAGRNIDQGVYIYDAEGLGLSAMSGKNILQAMAKLDDAVYPERLGKLIIINAPRLINMFWNVIKVMLHPVTREKITIHGADYKDVLLTHVDADKLPASYGGECECQCEGGCIPTNQFLQTCEFGKATES